MTTLLLGYTGPRLLLLTLAGARPLLLECPPELRVRAVLVTDPEAEPPPLTTMPPPPPLVRARPRVDPERVWQDDPPPPPERERAPDKEIDPRTVFKRRGAAPAGGATRSVPPPTTRISPSATHDHTIVSTNPTFRASEQGVKALLTYLRTSQILAAKSEKTTAEGTTIELLPDVFAHLAFMEGTAPPGEPSVLEGTLWFGSKPLPLPTTPARTCCLRLELVGARFASVSEAFLARLHQILYLRPEVVVVAHDPQRLRPRSARIPTASIPRFDMQELD